jgi:hypothetical protein
LLLVLIQYVLERPRGAATSSANTCRGECYSSCSSACSSANICRDVQVYDVCNSNRCVAGISLAGSITLRRLQNVNFGTV